MEDIKNAQQFMIEWCKKNNKKILLVPDSALETFECMYAFKGQTLPIQNVMPNWRDFKPRRQKLNLSMQDVANMCGCSKATISRLEKGNEVYYSTVKSIHQCYLSNGA